jgi:hypothetical protein
MVTRLSMRFGVQSGCLTARLQPSPILGSVRDSPFFRRDDHYAVSSRVQRCTVC